MSATGVTLAAIAATVGRWLRRHPRTVAATLRARSIKSDAGRRVTPDERDEIREALAADTAGGEE